MESDALTNTVLSRRRFMLLSAAGLASVSALSLLAACGDDDAVDDDATAADPDDDEPAAIDDTSEADDDEPDAIDDEPDAIDEDDSEAAVDGEPVRGGRLRIAYQTEPLNLHPHIDSGTEGIYVQNQIRDGLLNLGPHGEFVPGLATDMPERLDDRTYVFHLRDDVTFHNGKHFTADDVVANFDRLLGNVEGYHSDQATRFGPRFESIEATGDYEVTITLTAPWADFIPLIAQEASMRMTDVEVLDEAGDDYGISVAIGTGPFKFTEWTRGDRLVLERNEDYWGDEVYLDELVYQAIGEDSTRVAAFRAGEIDLLLAPPLTSIPDFDDDPDYNVLTDYSGNMKRLIFNMTLEPFDDQRVRQAMYYAINREEIVDAIYHGYATPGQGILPPWHDSYDESQEFYPYDPDRAMELLQEAGYDESNPLEFEIVTSDATEYVDLSTLIQAQLEQIGVRVEVTSVDSATRTARTSQRDGTANPDFQASVYRLIYGFPTTDYGWRTYHPDSVLNSYGYNQAGGPENPEVVELLEKSVEVTDPDEEREVYSELSELIMADVPHMILGWQDNVIVAHDYVKDVGITIIHLHPLHGIWLDQ